MSQEAELALLSKSDGDGARVVHAPVPVKPHTASPGILGLSGFGIATLLLQFVNLGWLNARAPVVFCGIFTGGLYQIIAGL